VHLGEICAYKKVYAFYVVTYTLGTSPIRVAPARNNRVGLIFTKNQTNNCFIGLEGTTSSSGGMIGLSTTTLTYEMNWKTWGRSTQAEWFATANTGAPTLTVTEIIAPNEWFENQ